MAKRPNILFIHAESMDGRLMGCMGHPSMQGVTPNLDRLAARGVLFTQAYSTCPVCNPSRASMWTGKYPSYYDCWNNHEGLHEDIPVLQKVLREAGYRTGNFGKTDYEWGLHSIRDRIGSWTRAAGILRPLNKVSLPRIVDDEPHPGDWDKANGVIAELREASGEAQPFFCCLSTSLVHPAFVTSRRYLDRIDPDRIDLPPGLRDIDNDDHPVDRYMRITKNHSRALAPELVREIRRVYFAMIAELDEIVGRVLVAVDALGLADSTTIIFSSDHGEMAGEHNQVLKRSMYEPSIHVPLIVAGPGVRRGAVCEDVMSLIDIYPTLLEMAGISQRTQSDIQVPPVLGPFAAAHETVHQGEHGARQAFALQAAGEGCTDGVAQPMEGETPASRENRARTKKGPDELDGESLMPQLTGEAPRRRDWAFAEYHGDRSPTGNYMLRRGRWKLVHHVGYDPQLFDLEHDPWEVENVAAQRSEVVSELQGILDANFDCEEIEQRERAYGCRSFRAWCEEAKREGTYSETMGRVYSGYQGLGLDDYMPWREEDEAKIEAWLEGQM